jgi:1-aminocyclopropane-1-carboxylate deaminase
MNDFLPGHAAVSLDKWDHPVFRKYMLDVEVLRLDKIHPEISGNKWFKLKYYLERARRENKKKLISFGGPYSNHLLALAAASALNGFSSLGMVRGEKPPQLSPVLLAAKEYGMELRFLSRKDYQLQKRSVLNVIQDITETDTLVIPEGGEGPEGIQGAEEILWNIRTDRYSHICSAVGTGTTLAGIINSTPLGLLKMGVSVLKGTSGFEPLHISWIKNRQALTDVRIMHEYHFGGYAKKTKPLIDFMNDLYAASGIPTDFVYTAKLFYAVLLMAEKNAFPSDSRLLILHTGGLRGNSSLDPGLLQF